ncbi:hypothetical protein ACSVC9_05360 [Clostridium sp. LBM24168]
MNKLILMNENKMINGNNAINPEYESHESVVQRKKTKTKNKKRSTSNKLKVMRNIAIIFAVGIVLIARYSIIYNMQKELSFAQSRVNELNRENENLKVDLVKYNNLQYIEDNAVKKLHMGEPEKSIAVYADLDKPIVKEKASDKSNKKFSSILNIIKQFKWR